MKTDFTVDQMIQEAAQHEHRVALIVKKDQVGQEGQLPRESKIAYMVILDNTEGDQNIPQLKGLYKFATLPENDIQDDDYLMIYSPSYNNPLAQMMGMVPFTGGTIAMFKDSFEQDPDVAEPPVTVSPENTDHE